VDHLRIELEDAELLRSINAAIAMLESPRDLMVRIGDKLEESVFRRFSDKTDPDGVSWPPLSPATRDINGSDWFQQRNRAFAGGTPGTLLQRTNQLLTSLNYNAGDDWLEIGTSRQVVGKGGRAWQVGLLHEFGTATMPRRGFLTADPQSGRLGAEDEATVLDIIRQMIGEAF